MESTHNPKSICSFRFSTVPILDSFTVDMDSFSNTSVDEGNFREKGTSNKIGQDHDDETRGFISPTGGVVSGAVSTLEKKPVVIELESGEGLGGGGGGRGERVSFRRNMSLKRSAQACSWYLNPRKIFLLCATLSCLGTMVLIYLAFSSGMMNVTEEIKQLES